MNNSTKLFIGIGLIAIIAIGYSTSNKHEELPAIQVETSEIQKEPTSDDNMEVVVLEKTETEITNTPTSEPVAKAIETVASTGEYTTYSAEAITNSRAEHIVLFFKATWCPSCRTLDKNIKANVSNIPAGVEIYEVDYDSNIALRKEYGVTTQHTLVLIKSDGTMINKWSGGNTLQSVIAKI